MGELGFFFSGSSFELAEGPGQAFGLGVDMLLASLFFSRALPAFIYFSSE